MKIRASNGTHVDFGALRGTSPTVDFLIETLKIYKEGGLRPATLHSYRQALPNVAQVLELAAASLNLPSPTAAADISTPLLIAVATVLKKDTTKSQSSKNASYTFTLGILRQALDQKSVFIPRSPFVVLKNQSAPTPKKELTVARTAEEAWLRDFQAFWQNPTNQLRPNPYDIGMAASLIIRVTGFNLSSILPLTSNSAIRRTANGLVGFTRVKHRAGPSGIIGEFKPAEVTLVRFVLQLLESINQRNGLNGTWTYYSRKQPISLGADDYTCLKSLIDRAREKAGITGVTNRGLRMAKVPKILSADVRLAILGHQRALGQQDTLYLKAGVTLEEWAAALEQAQKLLITTPEGNAP
ncbi:hypothetical protein ACFSM5_07820 [Lacibacterium aquatile]|uniref:Tyr recombinase domain-containing protein n=1 Tax=Lacibacterium aquatile TaxID=1168082 RepID=A0ABW5DNU3_9PROT